MKQVSSWPKCGRRIFRQTWFNGWFENPWAEGPDEQSLYRTGLKLMSLVKYTVWGVRTISSWFPCWTWWDRSCALRYIGTAAVILRPEDGIDQLILHQKLMRNKQSKLKHFVKPTLTTLYGAKPFWDYWRSLLSGKIDRKALKARPLTLTVVNLTNHKIRQKKFYFESLVPKHAD